MRAPVLLLSPTAGTSSPTIDSPGRRPPLVALQLAFWSCYGLALMVPWLGSYTVLQMLPNKLFVATTGVLASGVLGVVNERLLARGMPGPRVVLAAIAVAVPMGLAWDSLLAFALGQSVHFDLRRLGSLGIGVPQFAAGLYHALILAMWSMIHLVLRRPASHSVPLDAPAERGVKRGAEAVGSVPPGRLALRDGKRHVLVQADTIDWVQAEGDYVRVHIGAKNLLLRSTMTRTEAALPPGLYVRIHRSTLVRADHVREVVAQPGGNLMVVLRDGRRLCGSRRFAARVRAAVGLGSG